MQQWWKDKAAEIYQAIPDFGGFTVKANSEGQPGPQDYKRTHADGANLLADAVKPHGGIVMWRAFVYDASVDPDRVKRAYKEFVPLDGAFRDNVFVQTKNGPLDFMPREPFHPLFGAMPKTPNMVELQITQEYLGWSNHLVYLAPMWKEFFDADTFVKGPGSTVAKVVDGTLQGHARTGIAGVANTGSDRNWTGHHFAAGQLVRLRPAGVEPGAHVRRHRRRVDPRDVEPQAGDGQGHRRADARLARGVRELHDAARPASPDRRRPLRGDARERRSAAAGLDGDLLPQGRRRRASASTGRAPAAAPSISTPSRSPIAWNDPKTTPENAAALVPPPAVGLPAGVRPDAVAGDRRPLPRRAPAQAAQMEKDWAALKGSVDDERHAAVAAKLAIQAKDAAAWRDKCLTYFAQFSKQPIAPARRRPPADGSPGSRPCPRVHAARGPTLKHRHDDADRQIGPARACIDPSREPSVLPVRGRSSRAASAGGSRRSSPSRGWCRC